MLFPDLNADGHIDVISSILTHRKCVVSWSEHWQPCWSHFCPFLLTASVSPAELNTDSLVDLIFCNRQSVVSWIEHLESCRSDFRPFSPADRESPAEMNKQLISRLLAYRTCVAELSTDSLWISSCAFWLTGCAFLIEHCKLMNWTLRVMSMLFPPILTCSACVFHLSTDSLVDLISLIFSYSKYVVAQIEHQQLCWSYCCPLSHSGSASSPELSTNS